MLHNVTFLASLISCTYQGTPLFAARSILSGSYSGKTIPFADAPLLTGKALDAYVGCYREDAYNANTERYNSDDLRAVCEPELPIY